jgi:hypothetical protein
MPGATRSRCSRRAIRVPRSCVRAWRWPLASVRRGSPCPRPRRSGGRGARCSLTSFGRERSGTSTAARQRRCGERWDWRPSRSRSSSSSSSPPSAPLRRRTARPSQTSSRACRSSIASRTAARRRWTLRLSRARLSSATRPASRLPVRPRRRLTGPTRRKRARNRPHSTRRRTPSRKPIVPRLKGKGARGAIPPPGRNRSRRRSRSRRALSGAAGRARRRRPASAEKAPRSIGLRPPTPARLRVAIGVTMATGLMRRQERRPVVPRGTEGRGGSAGWRWGGQSSSVRAPLMVRVSHHEREGACSHPGAAPAGRGPHHHECEGPGRAAACDRYVR